MNELSTKVKKDKLNIFQKIRLSIFKRKEKISFEEYMKSPEYIKRDRQIISRLVRGTDLSEEQLLQIPEYEFISIFAHDKQVVQKFSKEQQVKWLEKGNVSLGIYSDEEINELIYNMIQDGNISAMKIIVGKNEREKEFLYYLKEKGELEEYLPIIISGFSESILKETLKHRPNLLCNLPEDKQVEIFTERSEMFQYASIMIQVKYISENPAFCSKASLEAKQEFINQDTNNILRLDVESQIEIVTINPNLYNSISFDAQNKIFVEGRADTIKSLLKYDINNSKNLLFLDEKTHVKLDEILVEVFDGVEQLDNDELINMMLHSKMFSAIGSLTPSSYSFHSVDGKNGGEEISGIDGYSQAQIQIIKKLNAKQMSEMISIDSNYILPYLAYTTEHGRCVLTEEEREISEKRCKELFLHIYGKEALEKYEQYISSIFDMQMDKNKEIKKEFRYREQVSELLKQGEIPLEEFKILFNKRIMEQNSPELIQQYLKEKSEGRDGRELFVQIIANTYGEKTKEILESRPNLDVHSINSLEVFDENILGEFGEAFVHDCISYNLRDFSEFLEVVKNPHRKDQFKMYYDTLVEIYGENVETMQKAISEYSYVEELLTETENVELTDTQYENLISVLCSRRNPFNITTLSELQNYEQIANQKLGRQMESYLEKIMQGKSSNEPLREVICQNLLGIRYENDSSVNYGDSVKFITRLYDVQTDESKDDVYTEDERKMLQVLNFLGKETDTKNLVNFAKLLMQEKGVRNPVTLQSAVQKVKNEQTQILNNSLSNISKLKELCESENGNENPEVYMEQDEGLEIYHLNGIPFTFLAHYSFANNDDFMQYEGQAGNTAICARVVTQEAGDLIGKFLYTHMEEDMLISSSARDALTTHVAKRVKNEGIIDTKVGDIPDLAKRSSGNEVSFYRRHRNHKDVRNDNKGGRKMPDAYGISSAMELNEETKAFCKKYNIPIVVLHADRYESKEDKKVDNGMEK